MKGKVYVIGFGPGDRKNMTFGASDAIMDSDVVVGYKVYTDLLRDMFPDKHYEESGMRKEIERCTSAVNTAMNGKKVAMVSSGDSGIYGMAGAVYQVAKELHADIDIDVIPGITAASSAASLLGAPLMHDFAVISLSDLLTPLDLILKRVENASSSDMIICLYNPKSKGRTEYLGMAADIILEHRGPHTPVGIAKNIGRDGQETIITTLGELKQAEIDMFSTVIIGNSQSYAEDGLMITPRGYSM